eukprot:g36451.t1
MDHVHRDTMYKTLDERGKIISNITLILMATFLCSCIKLSRHLKFAKKNTFDYKSNRKWSAHSILEKLRKKEMVDPIAWFPKQTVKVIWKNVSSPELSNKHQDIAWLLNNKLTLTECCRQAYSKVQDYVLWDAQKLGAAAAK